MQLSAWPRRVHHVSHTYLRRFRTEWTRFEQVWLGVFVAVILGVYVTLQTSPWEVIAAVTGLLTVVLAAKGWIETYYFGIVNSILYAWLAFQSQYYGEVMLNAGYYLPMQFVGLWLWERHMADTTVQPVELTWRQRGYWLGLAGACIVGYGVFLRDYVGVLPLFESDNRLPFIDAASTVLSVLAQYFMVRRFTEQWTAWIIVNVLSIYMWVTTVQATGQGWNMVVMWTAYLVNSCYGLYNWRQLDAGSDEGSPEATAEVAG